MVDPFRVAYIGQAVSGLAILGLGGLLLSARPRRRYLTSFGIFLLLWGGFIVLGNGTAWALDIGQQGLARRLILLHVAALALAYLPLAHFTLTYPTVERSPLTHPAVTAGLVIPALIGGGAFLIDPGLLHQGFTGEGARSASIWGPLYPLFAVLFLGTILAAIGFLTVRYREAQHTIERRRVLYVILAFTLYVAFESGENLFFVLGLVEAASAQALDPLTLAVAGSVVAGLAVVAWTAWRLARDPNVRPGRRAGIVAFAVATPLGFGLLSGLSLSNPALPQILTLGIWRLGAVALLVYGILRFEVFGLERGVARTVAAGGLVAVVLGVLITTQQLLAGLTGSQTLSAIVVQGLVLGGVALAVIHRPGVIQRLLEPLDHQETPATTARQNLEIYEAALARATTGPGDPGPELATLRERLGISAEEHGLLMGLLGGQDPDPEPRTGTILADRYRIERALDQSSQAAVWLAWDQLLDRQVVVKQVRAAGPGREGVLRRFLHEARVTAEIEHPNVVDIYGFGYATGGPYLVMEHLGGGNLGHRLRDGPPVDPREAVRIVGDILSGLAHLHDHGILHRDLEPSNVLLTADGVAKVADLGLAFPWQPGSTLVLEEQPPDRAGTPAYMAPEILRGLPPDPATDIYGAGAILYEAVNGSHYLGPGAPDLPGLADRILTQDPRPPEVDLPEELRQVWETALAKAPEARYGSAREMAEDLMQALPLATDGDPARQRGQPSP